MGDLDISDLTSLTRRIHLLPDPQLKRYQESSTSGPFQESRVSVNLIESYPFQVSLYLCHLIASIVRPFMIQIN